MILLLFHGILTGSIDLQGLEFDIELLDIQQLNQRLLSPRESRLDDVIKASFAAALHVSEDYWVLPSGSALGFGVGPLLLAAIEDSEPHCQTQCTFMSWRAHDCCQTL